MRYLLILAVFVVGCKKNDNPNPFRVVKYTYADVWNSIGVQYEKKYWLSDRNKPPYFDTLIFHANNTITESNGTSIKTFSVTSYAIDTFVHMPTDPAGWYSEWKHIIYNKLDTPILSGILSSELSYKSLQLQKSDSIYFSGYILHY